MNALTGISGNAPSSYRHQTEIDCQDTCESWCEVMWDAQRLQALLARAKGLAAKLEADAKANGIPCETGMADEIDAAINDMALDGLVASIDEQTSKYLDR